MLKLQVCVYILIVVATTTGTPPIQTTSYEGVPQNYELEASSAPFEKIGTKYYIVELKKKLNWYEAAHYCRTLNADLVSIESETEWKALESYMRNKGITSWLWTSGNDLGKSRQFAWLRTGNSIVWFKWSPGQPDNANERCINTWLLNNEYVWNDLDCNVEHNFICQTNTPRTVSFTVW